MNTKQEAIRRLREYPAARCAVDSMGAQMRTLQSQLCSPGAVRLDSIGRGTGSREDWQLSILEKIDSLKARQQQTQSWLEAVDLAMGCLSREEQTVLRRLFSDGRAAEEVCEELGLERSSVYRRKDRALEKFTVALYGPTV